MDLTLITYTHSKCKDIIRIHNESIQKYLKPKNHFILSDYEIDNKYAKTLIYNTNEPYSIHYVKCIKNLNIDFFIHDLDDEFLYKQVNLNKITEYINFLKQNKEYSFIRLCQSGKTFGEKITKTLYSIETNSEQIFSMQPTIWRTEDFVKIYEYETVKSIRDESQFSNACRKFNIKGLFHFDDEPKRGMNHFDSNVYPAICTALVLGKWNLSEYQEELLYFINNYNIDINLRGIF